MTRFFAAAAIAAVSLVLHSLPAHAQANDETSAELQCFPWQEPRNGRCIAKPAGPQAAPPAALGPQLSPDPCSARSLSGQCRCPAASHLDPASGACVTDAPVVASPPAPAAPSPAVAILCTGGTVADGACVCPSGFNLMPADGNAAGGICAKVHADNCLGGELTVSGACLCPGQVVMSGETYGLEYVNGKCVPKRCPDETVLQGSRCVPLSGAAAVPRQQPAAEVADDAEHRRHCGHGMVRTHAGCVPAARRHRAGLGAVPGELQRYYRTAPMPGFSNPSPGN